MEYTDIRYSDITKRVLICECQELENWGTDGLPNELYEGEQSHAYIIKHPISTQLTSCDGIHWHQVQWHYYVYWFCECQKQHNWRMDGLQMNCVRESSLMITCNQAPNWNTIDFLQWNTLTSGTVTFLCVLILWVPEQHNWGTMVSKWIVWGRAVSCLHNQAPNLNTIDFLRWNTLTSGTVTLLRVIDFCECQSWRTGGRMVSKWLLMRESSLMLT